VLATVMLAACSFGPSDEQIATDVRAKFYASETLKGTNVQVAARNGEVTLSGEVPSDTVRFEAFKVALNAAGVKKVNDQMTVRPVQAQVAEAAKPEPAPAPKRIAKPAIVRHSPRPVVTPVSQPAPAPPAVSAPAPVEPAPAPPQVREATPPPPPAPPKPRKVSIPAGTSFAVRMIDSVDSGVNQPGETFRASLDAPVDVDGEEVLPRGAEVTVRLAEAKSAGRVTGRGELKLELAYFEYNGRRYTLDTTDVSKQGRSEGKRSAATIGGAAAVGAIIGAIAGGGKGAAIGSVAGAGAGTAATVITKGQQVKVPSETLLEFKLESPVTVTLAPDGSGNHRRSSGEPSN